MATRKNASPNPALKNNNTGWGGGSTPTRSTGLSGLPRTTGAHYSANSYASLPTITAGAGETWTLSCYFQNNTGTNLGSKTVYFVCKKPGDDFSITTSVALPTGVTRVSITGVTLTGTTGLYMLIDSFDATIGSGVEITGVLFEKVGALDTYFDGDDVGAVWDGTNGNSSSTLTTGSDIVISDGSGGAGTGGQSDGRVLGDGNGSSGAGGAPDGRALGDASGGAGAGSTADSLALGDASGGAGVGGTSGGLTLGDGSGSSGAGGTSDGRALGDGAGGAGAGGGGNGTALGDASGGVGIGGSADTLPSVPVIVQDTSGGIGAGGSPDSISQVVHDTMVMPVLLSALACLQGEAAKVTNPPAIYTVRPGDAFEPSADPWIVECCAGVGWVRQVSSYETDVDTFPDPLTRPISNGCPPDSMAVVVEIGISRCYPVAGDSRGSVVTTAQWLAAAQQQADDHAALRRVLCCMRALYDNSDVASGQVNPLPMQGGCGGMSATVTIRRDACDC